MSNCGVTTPCEHELMDEGAPTRPKMIVLCDRCGSRDGHLIGADGMWGSLCDSCYEAVPIVQIGAILLPGETWCPNCHRLKSKYERRGVVLGWFPRACGGRLGCLEQRGKPKDEVVERSPESAAAFDRLRSAMHRSERADTEASRPA